MGQLASMLSVSTNTVAEIFMIQFLSSRGPTPYTTEIFPDGSIGDNEEIATVRNKFKWAITNQSRFERAMRILRGEKVTRCLSPCMLVNLDLPAEATKNPAPKKAKAGILRSKPSILRNTLSHEQRSGLGTLERLVSARYDSGEEEIMAFDVVKSQQLKNRRTSKRTRSRPEPALRFEPEHLRRQAKSVSIITEAEKLTPIEEIPSEVVVESIPINKKPKRAWPSRGAINKVLKDPMNKPTTYFLARFRKNADSEFVEVEYRLNRLNRQESFQCQGSLLSLLDENVQAQYESDKLNNNLDEMALFFKHAPHFFNKLEGRIWFNGYFITCEDTVDARMKLKSLEMDPPTLVFDMSGLKHISATRKFSRLNLNGKGDDVVRSFILRGKCVEDMKSLKIIHETGTVFVSIGLPFISGIPVSTSKKDIEVEA